MKMKFRGIECSVEKREYFNKLIALKVISIAGEPLATATINPIQIFEEDELKLMLDNDLVCIKEYGENNGMVQFLEENNIINKQGEWRVLPPYDAKVKVARCLI